MKNTLLLVGAGGHCKVILDLLLKLQGYEIAGIIDLKKRIGDKVFGVPVVGTDSDLPKFFKKGVTRCFISVGSVGDAWVRVKLYNFVKKIGFILPNLISPETCISSQIILGEGNYIAPGVIINAGARIGNNCILNTGTIIEHDCQIGNFVHLSPGSILSGGVFVGNYSHIGTGSMVIQNLEIGASTVIGAGSVVTKNIRKCMVAYGNPCKERKKNG